MNKLWPALTIFAAFCLALASCGGTPPTLSIAGIPWPDDEITVYTLEDTEGNTMGSANLTVHKENNTYVLSQHYVVGDQQVVQDISVTVSADDLKPVSGTQSVKTADTTVDITTIYADSRLSITATVDGKQQSAQLDVPNDTYDNDEALFLFRTIPFEIGYTASYTNAVPSAGLLPKATISILAREEVETPAGTFDSYKLKLSAQGATIFLWYSAEAPHYLLKYDNSATIIRLTEHP